MCSRIHHTVACVIVGLIVTVALCVKSKLQDLHPGISCLLQKLTDFLSQKSKVFRDDLAAADHLVQSTEQFHARSLYPGTVQSSIFRCRNLIVGFKSAEVVDPDCIVKEERMFHS